jgi:beta-1,4-glucosyltransferase
LKQEPALIVNDGVGMDLAAMVIHGRRYRENLNGTDFVPLLLARLKGQHKLFLLGGKPGIARTAGAAIDRKFGHQVVGCADGYADLKSPLLVQEMNASGADIVLIALGNPLQEQWMAEHLSSLRAGLLIGVGALFDFLSGDKQRAPQWVRRLRCEWLFRLCLEPRRLLRRYTWDVLLFLFLCLRYRKQAD